VDFEIICAMCSTLVSSYTKFMPLFTSSSGEYTAPSIRFSLNFCTIAFCKKKST